VLTSAVASPPTALCLTPFETLERAEQFSGNFSFVAPRKKVHLKGISYGNILVIR